MLDCAFGKKAQVLKDIEIKLYPCPISCLANLQLVMQIN